jgi:predicted GNAT family N-acyltransferase
MSSTGPEFSIRPATWAEDEEALRAVRQAVFVEEQDVPPPLEWDGLDDDCEHLLVTDEAGQSIGTARLLSEGKLGRLAVMPAWRGKGVGQALMEGLLDLAHQRGLSDLCLDAQVRAIGFYEPFGFRAVGPVFDDAGIPHRKMIHTV